SGTMAPATGKYVIVTKSPRSRTVLDSYFGGTFGAQLKFAGFDAVIVEGASEKPVYLKITSGSVEIKGAEDYWGGGAYDTVEAIKKDEGEPKMSVLAIGPAGERLSKIATVNADIIWNAGRGGAGAVMGSKKLKAVAVRAEGQPPIANPDKLREASTHLTKNSVLTEDNLWAKTDGTPVLVDMSHNVGVLPTRYFSSGVFEGHDKINTDVIKAHLETVKACYACPLACKRLVKVKGKVYKAPEYETLAMAGANCGVSDFEAIVEFNHVCGNLGIDTITTGNLVAFVMALYEDGVLGKDKLEGIEARFGSGEALVRLAEKIGKREGIGEILADGVRPAIERLGVDPDKYAVDVKGQEVPGYEPRGSWGMALAYSTSDRGACHLRAWAVAQDAFGNMPPQSFEGKAELVKDLEDQNSVKWSLIVCDFWAINYDEMAMLLSPAWGREVKVDELKLIGERIWNLGRLFNVREGYSRKDDKLPKKFFTQALKGGPTDGVKLPEEEFDKTLDKYYELRGWDSNGIPKRETLERLGLAGLK
ncbi:MAG: aldehyde ferredoxin oxidoreductase family protein, partial [Candidatus Hecatellaceae archaeon]